MCGIYGIIQSSPLTSQDDKLLKKLSYSLRHRGPDGGGEFRDDPCVAIGMRRLSIIDLEGGWQPLFNETREFALVANGEIYNFIELRKSLEARGHVFSTGSDCETIVHLYEEYGRDCVNHLRGMFAFALWDSRRRALLIARDRMGEKPLFLHATHRRLVFSSELGSLVGSGAVPFDLDQHAISLYYHYGYVPEPASPVRGVTKLPAAHTLDIAVDPWRLEKRKYWCMEDAPPIDGDPGTRILEVLEEIGDLIIRSDVPVGVALSGGLDSSAIATLAASRYSGTIQAFTIGYTGNAWQDERADAAELADHLGIPLHTIELDVDQVVSDFPEMCFRRDDLIQDMAGPSYLAVMRLARSKNVPVMLMGQGGDELFWGYPWVTQCVAESQRKCQQQSSVGTGLRDYLSIQKPPISYTQGLRWLRGGAGLLEGIRRFAEDRAAEDDQLVFYNREHGFEATRRLGPRTFSRDFLEATADSNPCDLFTGSGLWDRLDISITRLICETYLLGNGINQGDRLSMAASVECRLPLVDYKLVDTVIGLRKNTMDHMEPPKKWLRDALRNIVPEFVMHRPKRGFTPPWRRWATGLFKSYGRHVQDGYLVQQGVITPEAARRLAKGVTAIGTPRPMANATLVLEMWARGMQQASSSALSPAERITGIPGDG